jgi:hypothetical protein
MKIEAGKYYRTRGNGKNLGQVVGPMYPVEANVYVWVCWGFSFTETGRYDVDSESEYDLISEVYVHDTPPSDEPAAPPAVQQTEDKWRERLLAAGPGAFLEEHDRKTLRDEFALALAGGFIVNGVFETKGQTAANIYRAADAMMEARKK